MTPALPRQAFIGVGANLGDRAATIRAALARLRDTPGVNWLVSSPTYETAPVGVIDQPAFLNLAIGVETTLSPEALLGVLLDIEQAFGRVRKERWGPRTLDLDLLVYEDEVRTTEELTLPHPRFLGRDFVRVPLSNLIHDSRFDKPCWNWLRQEVGPPHQSPGIELFS